jgi:hypothetical protein
MAREISGETTQQRMIVSQHDYDAYKRLMAMSPDKAHLKGLREGAIFAFVASPFIIALISSLFNAILGEPTPTE